MNIYLDFDRTLFNTDKFYQDLELIIQKYININLFNQYKVRPRANGFNLMDTLHEIDIDYEVDSKVYDEVKEFILDASKYLYDDVIPFLKKHDKEHLFILSKGNKEYQLMKIENCHILDYFQDIIITQDDKGELDLDYQNSMFIDDNPRELESILSRSPKRIMRIKRVNAYYNDIETVHNIEIINSLDEIKK